ncbi:hypothetical protein HPB51_013177 [Rhipicephalus microplus]|uniref:Retrotransposon gag domain-containing protein n=1 Tax=Rhipicephalus microplus TaxID=6941 RepID=A0A9J6E1J4_RHIMP|nr:hypothetical protein HPB51_013177 [Rhipicephalus microplus]
MGCLPTTCNIVNLGHFALAMHLQVGDVKNVHLAPQWLVQLEKKLHALQPHPAFRLFLTLEVHPKVPVNLLRAGRVFLFEPPPGIRANLLRTFSTVPAQRMMKRMTSGGSSGMASGPTAAADGMPRLQGVVEELSLGTDGSAMERQRIAVVVRDRVMATSLPTAPHSPEEFLERLENFCLVTGVAADKRLTHVVPAALEGGAKLWWRFVRGFDSWEQFTAAFRSELSSIDAKRRVKAELEQRTQHPEENLKEFIYAIATFYDRIGEEVSEAEKVQRVLRQMHPQLQDLAEGHAYNDLAELVKAADGLMERA